MEAKKEVWKLRRRTGSVEGLPVAWDLSYMIGNTCLKHAMGNSFCDKNV